MNRGSRTRSSGVKLQLISDTNIIYKFNTGSSRKANKRKLPSALKIITSRLTPGGTNTGVWGEAIGGGADSGVGCERVGADTGIITSILT
jgi:hypothetical protein